MKRAATPEGRVFHTLDALRGVAAIGVVTFHMSGMFAPVAASSGYLAVDLFFMMSGVVLSHAYEARFRAGMGTIDFMRARLIRLFPLYFIGTLLGIMVTIASMLGRNSMGWHAAGLFQAGILALLFLPNISGTPSKELFPLNIPSWSLFLEILVNLFFVLFWPRLSSRRLVAVSMVTGATVALAIVHTGSIDQGSIASSFPIGLARTIFGFSIGVLIARHVHDAPRSQSSLGVLGIVSVVSIAICGWPTGAFRAVWDAVCVLVVFPLVVYFGTIVNPAMWLRRIATFLGVISYAIYVLHSPLASIVNSAGRHFADSGSGVSAPYLGLITLVVLLIGCWLVDQYFDMPVRRQLNRIVPKMQAILPR